MSDDDRSDPTSPNYRVSIRVAEIPQEHMDAMLADMRERAARADPADEFIVEEIASWAEVWIAGSEGVVLGHGPTRDAAVEDALDFCGAASGASQGLDIMRATGALARSIGLIPLHYVVRDGHADVA